MGSVYNVTFKVDIHFTHQVFIRYFIGIKRSRLDHWIYFIGIKRSRLDHNTNTRPKRLVRINMSQSFFPWFITSGRKL